MAVIDVCTVHDEADLWEIHYKTLFDHVDEFVVVEFDQTFSGKPKELLGERTDIWYDPIYQWPKVKYVSFYEKDWEKYRELAESSPNTVGADHWKREFMQKESIKDALTHLNDDDIVFVSDVDEIWRKTALRVSRPQKLKLDVYTYFLNNRSSEQFWGTLVANYSDIKDACLNHLRSGTPGTLNEYGWHFTSMGGPEALKKKLTDSYTQESYATPEVIENVAYNISNGKDFLGRNFTYTIDESCWPKYLQENRGKYQHLMKPEPNDEPI